jgi:D-tyrosyl-tRNA(Tyr) deacylase
VKTVVQRVSSAAVRVDGETVGEIGEGLLVLAGFGPEDGEEELAWMAEKLAGLRVFPDDDGRMDRGLDEVGGSLLVVPQFTLYGDISRGRRPSFTAAAGPGKAERLYGRFLELCRDTGVPVESGEFGAMMDVELVNDGPVTLVVER